MKIERLTVKDKAKIKSGIKNDTLLGLIKFKRNEKTGKYEIYKVKTDDLNITEEELRKKIKQDLVDWKAKEGMLDPIQLEDFDI